MARALPWIQGFGAVLFLVAAVWLGRLEQGGPAHADLMLEGGIPASFYLPTGTSREAFLEAPPRGERPPAVALMHGFSSDRLGVSTLARRLALAGYAVLAFDASGHGQNRNPFEPSYARADAFFADFSAAVDFLRSSPLVDGARIAVMGHSMGAGAALDFATRDSGIDATVLISGGFTTHGPHHPPNALFVYAAGDPERVKLRSGELAARLADGRRVEPGQRYGDASRGTAVRVAEVPGTDHASIVWSEAGAREIRDWLDEAFGRDAATSSVAPEPRLLAVGFVALSLLLVLPGLGRVVGGLVPRVEERGPSGGAAGLLALAASLLATMPLLAAGTPLAMLPVEVGDVVVSHFALAGLVLLAVGALRGELPLRAAFSEPGRSLAGAVLGIVAVYVLFLPIGLVFHRMTLTPERATVFLAATLALLPFAVSFQWLLRRGPPGRAALFCGLGRVLVLAVLVLGVAANLLSFVVILMLPSLVITFALLELLSAGIYAASRNLAAISLIDAAWLALIVAAVMPIRA